MGITVERGPELEERLRMQAAERGVPLQVYVERLIHQAANALTGERPTLAEFKAEWAGFMEGLGHIAPTRGSLLT